MKNHINRLSAKAFAGALLIGSVFMLNTPTSAQSPAWAVSKDVQKVANKKQFEDQDLMKSHIHAAVLGQTWMISKGVSNVGTEIAVAKGNIPSKGTPAWANSKGVHQIKTSKPVKQDKTLFETSQEITRRGE